MRTRRLQLMIVDNHESDLIFDHCKKVLTNYKFLGVTNVVNKGTLIVAQSGNKFTEESVKKKLALLPEIDINTIKRVINIDDEKIDNIKFKRTVGQFTKHGITSVGERIEMHEIDLEQSDEDDKRIIGNLLTEMVSIVVQRSFDEQEEIRYEEEHWYDEFQA